ncbi:MAG: hypothetical protein AB7J35_15680 [Dehalococcoidia bacterium]
MEESPATLNETEATIDPTGEPNDEIESLRQELEASRENERLAVERLRSALLAGDPALDAEMLAGDTLIEVEANYRRAMDVISRLRDHVARETAGRIPAGAPGRSRHTPRTPFEKIRAGLADSK